MTTVQPITKKMIKLPEAGMLPINGGIYGPIETPHLTDVEDIRVMLFYGTKVLEVIEGQNDVELTLANYNTDNTIVKKAKQQEQQPVAPQQPKQQPVTPQQPKQQPKKVEEVKVEKQVKGK